MSDWKNVDVNQNSLFSHGTDSMENVKSIINDGILFAKTKTTGTMGPGLYADSGVENESMELTSGYIIFFKPKRKLIGFNVGHDYGKYQMEGAWKKDFDEMLDSADF